MGLVTFQVIDGFEKGRSFSEIPTPLTIGREEDNHIQLNDERVSRFHVKIQEESGRIILIDLDSTNGTRVNGHPVQMRVLQVGDQLSVGRSLLVYGSPQQILDRYQQLYRLKNAEAATGQIGMELENEAPTSGSSVPPSIELTGALGDDIRPELFPAGAPELPGELRPLQTAQVSDLLAFVHDQIAAIADTAIEDARTNPPSICLDWANWQKMLNLEMTLATYLQKIAAPRNEAE